MAPLDNVAPLFRYYDTVLLKSAPSPLQVPEGYAFDNMFYKWDIKCHVSPPCHYASSALRLPACVLAAACAMQSTL